MHVFFKLSLGVSDHLDMLNPEGPTLARANAMADDSKFQISRPLNRTRKSSRVQLAYPFQYSALFLIYRPSSMFRDLMSNRFCCHSPMSAQWTPGFTRDWTAIFVDFEALGGEKEDTLVIFEDL